jgi:hypothetical protein
MDRSELQEAVHAKLRAERVRVVVGLDQPDYLCFLWYALLVLQQVYLRHRDAEKVDFVVSEKRPITHNLGAFHQVLLKFTELEMPHLTHLVGDLIPGRQESRVPLQAADLFCWHLQRHYQQTAEEEDNRNLLRLVDTAGLNVQYEAKERAQLAQAFIEKLKNSSGEP